MAVVALLGAPCTGADALADALRERVPADSLQITRTPSPQAQLVLLMGLDLPCPAHQRPTQEAADARLRAELARSGKAFQVVYGQGMQRVEHALKAIKSIAACALPASAGGHFDAESARQRAWHCEKCSDPECEHRLFSALLRPAAPGRA
ncbi:MAG: hypothetical protein QM569_05950 [Acidovorax sp.]|uniref:hypothetical protein n=1 Tax=Acidovorax sp. TaxID=1872122 RepID=UPI0039E6ADAC